MAQRQVEFEEKEQAIIFANKANDAAQTIESEELKAEISELLAQLVE
jgi:hypothetical protein